MSSGHLFSAPGLGPRLLLRAQALIIGFHQLSDPAPVVRQLLADPEMAPFVVDFTREFSETFSALLRGLEWAATEGTKSRRKEIEQ
ncbi:MAG TPA: hypothetical protein VF897_05805, partial [Roseiflexaceae bacterium]